MQTDGFNWLTDLASPLGIALLTLIASSLYSVMQQRSKDKNEKISVLDNLIITFNNADEKLEKLKTDATTNMFNFRNITPAERVLNRLQDLSYKTEVFSDSALRREILEYTDSYVSLIEDIRGLETYANGQFNKFNSLKEQSLNDLRSLKLEGVKMGYTLDNDSQFKSLKEEKKFIKEEQALTGVYNDLNGKFVEARNELDTANQFSKDTRVHLAIRIVDTQTKLRELNHKLQETRDVLVNNWYRS